MGPLLLFDRAADRAPARATARMHLSVRTGKDCSYNARMLGIVLATVAFLAASFFIKRHLDGIGIPKTMVRGMVIFVLALAVAYGVAFVVDWLSGPSKPL